MNSRYSYPGVNLKQLPHHRWNISRIDTRALHLGPACGPYPLCTSSASAFPAWQSRWGPGQSCTDLHWTTLPPICHAKTSRETGVKDSQKTVLSTVLYLSDYTKTALKSLEKRKKESGKRLDLKKKKGRKKERGMRKRKARRSTGQSVIKGFHCVLNDALIP